MLLCVMFSILSAFFGVMLIEASGIHDDVMKLIGSLCLVGCGIFMTFAMKDVGGDIQYYLPAEIVAENETSVYFGTKDGHIYYIEKLGFEYPQEYPYLLHMNDNGTKDITDDEIIGVWRSVA